MKAINKWALAVAMLAGLASCEMKNEILGKDPMTGDTGTLNLYVETGKTTKGTTDQVDQFPVTITGTDVEYTKKFDSYAELKQAGDVTLPVVLWRKVRKRKDCERPDSRDLSGLYDAERQNIDQLYRRVSGYLPGLDHYRDRQKRTHQNLYKSQRRRNSCSCLLENG